MFTESNIWCIITLSTGIKDLCAALSANILAEGFLSRTSNTLTGLCVFSRNNNLILVEGDKEKVHESYQKSKKNPYHHSIIKIYDGPVPFRCFEDYPLAFKALAPSIYKELDTFKTPGQLEYFEEYLKIDHISSILVKNFIINNS
ncbi:BLUF domain-containing protein [Desertivirga arenae]|uniref:BLUF domain-containing protein n=1 Tax=Desertivirga arenae TaxID=2810309 RepID=UPI001A96813C|nr:BLUF domain-containing protein [Pedobacter sp. SYSU D00823]